MKTVIILTISFLTGINTFGQDMGKEILKVDTPQIIIIHETMPEFPGGQEGLHKFIRKNFIYPKSAEKDKVEGVVIVGFIVDANGDIKNTIIEKGVRTDLDNAAIEIVKKMPKWNPGTQGGKAVDVKFRQPIGYKLH